MSQPAHDTALADFSTRTAELGDIGPLRAVEIAAAQRFRGIGMHRIADSGATLPCRLRRLITDGCVQVVVVGERGGEAGGSSEKSIAGFALFDQVEDSCYLAELAVAPQYAGYRLGARLIDAVGAAALSTGVGRMVLRTFREVPWNAPYYERLGFHRIEAEGASGGILSHPAFREIVAQEAAAGLRPADRVFMWRPLDLDR